jgi:sec-independent protein translocase protein TatA
VVVGRRHGSPAEGRFTACNSGNSQCDIQWRSPRRTTVMAIAMLEGTDLIIVLVVALLLFGSSQLPKLARSLGQAKKELDRGMNEGPDLD